jgi:hypothetical protein
LNDDYSDPAPARGNDFCACRQRLAAAALRLQRRADFVALDLGGRFRDAVSTTARRSTMADFTPYQQKIIKRYYDNQDSLQQQRLSELVTDLYLSEGKKRQKIWTSIATAMRKLGVPQSRIDHLLKQDNPSLVAEVVKELHAK